MHAARRRRGIGHTRRGGSGISSSCYSSALPGGGQPPSAVQMAIDYLERILNSRVYDVAVETPLEFAPNLSARLGNRLMLKREDMQPVFSFKLRGRLQQDGEPAGARSAGAA